ncbi:uncharacterized protein LOC131996139 [Stomoxys calcitrans]|uniref:uncharacterized protein LOC131996139 n=1 Tax=Stomoxys calcitrans TaxID=35570 RepID=UPI0027E366CA|nr:uncharacterized protein LOC131996139 [Stomoxys calcitrans]
MSALTRFTQISDALIIFNADICGESLNNSSVYSLEVHKEELRDIWQRMKPTYEESVQELMASADENSKADLETIRARYHSTYTTYVDSVAKISACIESKRASISNPIPMNTSSVRDEYPSVHLPPCDTELFHGDYLAWPTFRDLFTAIYIKNSRLSPVEKLFHLNNKTRDEARDIVRKAPLTNEGFDIAWKALQVRYENRRLLINSQLKVLFSLQRISVESGDSIKEIQNSINSIISALKLYQIEIQSWDPIFVYLCSTRLPENTLSLWEQSVNNKTECPSWKDLDSFLTSRYQTLETVRNLSDQPSTSKSSEPPKVNVKLSGQKRVNSYQNSLALPPCKLCPDVSHTIRVCPKFISMCYNDKLAFIKKIKLCLNCFSKGHVVKDCKSAFNCSKCQRRHNTLLCNTGTESGNQCITAPNTPVLQSTSEDTPQISSGVTIQSCAATTSRKVLLGTAIIHILHRGEIFKARAVFDSGSEASFISEHLFNLLRLNSKRISAQISGLNGCVSACSQKICDLCLSSPIDSGIFINASAIVLPRLTSSLPTFTADSDMFSRLPDIRLADPDFFRTSYIDILIGADLIPQVMLGGVRHKVCGTLMAQETVFGWILTGPVASDNISSFRTTVSYFNELALDERISKFFEMEDIPKRKHMSDDDKYCEEYFAESTRRGPTGRYVVSLPFKKEFGNTLRLGPSKRNVTAQYFRNENRLIRTPDLKVQYDKVLKEYLELGHMKEVPSNPSQDDSRYFLPHHAVVRPDSVTTKVRVVFNASNPSSNGVSLNDVLYCGPSLQLDLTSLLLQWRFYKIVFNSDIEKMYRQISVNPSHTPFQRIIFRDDPNDNLHEYELQTVTFGLNCAPYLALRTIQQLATDIKDVYPLASHVLMSCMYVDDVMAGGHDVSSAIKVQTELTAALESAGFALRKWTSNSSEFLASIPREHLLNEDFLQFNDNSTAKTLGVRWNARYDYFYFSAKAIRPNERPTKRFILSEISKLFDPAGWLCPYIVLAKLLMRDIWASNTDWDSPVPTHLLTNWLDFLANYSDINDLRISRWVQYTPDCEVQLHGFCDASEKAYAATIYSRTIDSNGNINTYLLVAKSRVSPLKTVSIPRLELCAALLLAETIEALMQVFPIPNTKIFCWSDSMIVLAWLKKPAFLWKTFIANRVSKISEIISGDNWSHVESRHNPADIASRGAYPKELSGNCTWWCGPPWLQLPPSLWPIPSSVQIDETLMEVRQVQNNFAYFPNFEDLLDRFSCLGRALRVMSYVYRFIASLKGSRASNDSIHSEGDVIETTRNSIIKLAQMHQYPNEYRKLSQKELIPTSSSLSNLNPFIDKNGLMRVCSRIAGSESLTYDEKYPIILPYHSTFSRLLLRFIHTITLHGGNNLMLRMLRLQFWMPRAKNLIKSTVHNCKICVIAKHKLQKQLMGTLPPERTTLSRPFTNTGLDFAGPFEIKAYTGRSCKTTKGYVCIFVCFATRAIHLEFTTSLSTAAFLASFHRFVSRRGCPRNLYSDNGTTFVGASKEISQNFLRCSRDSISANFSYQSITWHFIPPGAPHMGGLWEAGVKSFKLHFRKMAGNHKFTLEEFATILARIEACLNSRPISPVSEDPNDLLALTPGHFLTGGPILSIAEPSESDGNLSVLNRWRRVRALCQQFSIRWKHEYIKEIHKRMKWQTPQKNLEVGSMVVIRDDCLPPNEWRLGRVSKIYTGKDHLVRVADIVTTRGIITRPIVKIVLLPPC